MFDLDRFIEECKDAVKSDPTHKSVNEIVARADGRVEAAGARSLSTGDCAPLGKDIIHSVLNPTLKLSGALHVYGGDFFEAHRSEWCPENLTEREMDVQASMRSFEDANKRLGLH